MNALARNIGRSLIYALYLLVVEALNYVDSHSSSDKDIFDMNEIHDSLGQAYIALSMILDPPTGVDFSHLFELIGYEVIIMVLVNFYVDVLKPIFLSKLT